MLFSRWHPWYGKSAQILHAKAVMTEMRVTVLFFLTLGHSYIPLHSPRQWMLTPAILIHTGITATYPLTRSPKPEASGLTWLSPSLLSATSKWSLSAVDPAPVSVRLHSPTLVKALSRPMTWSYCVETVSSSYYYPRTPAVIYIIYIYDHTTPLLNIF